MIKRASYPTAGLSKAVEEVAKLWRAAQHAPMTSDVAVKTLGFKSMSGPAKSRLAALKHYGLVEEAGKEMVRLSALAKTIVVQPDGKEKTEAIMQAAMTPKLFQEILPTYRTASDPVLKGFLITAKGYNEESAKVAIRSFRDTINFAKLDETPLDTPSEDGILLDTESESEDEGFVWEDLTKTDSEKPVIPPKKLPARKGVVYSINIELMEDGSINVVTSDGSLTSSTLKLLTEVFELKEKYEVKSDRPVVKRNEKEDEQSKDLFSDMENLGRQG
jgi:hypothetical protein